MDLHRRPDDETIGERDLTRWRTPPGRALESWIAGATSWTSATGALVLTVLLGLGAVLGLTAAAAETYEAVLAGDGLAALDHPVLREAMTLRTAGLDRTVTAFTDIGGPVWMPVLGAVLMTAAAVAWRSWAPVVLTILAAAGSLAMTVVGKQLVGRVRPPLPDAVPPFEYSPSFPSGHTLNTTVVIGILTYLLLTHLRRGRSRTAAVVGASTWIVAMGLSRVFLGHHWLTDVVTGWLLGLAWVLVLAVCHRLWLTVVRHHAVSSDRRSRPGQVEARRPVGSSPRR